MSIADEYFIKEAIEKGIQIDQAQGTGSRGYYILVENGKVVVEEYYKPCEELLR